MRLLTSILAAVGITSAFSCLFGNRYLAADNYELNCRRLPEEFNGKKIVLLADLHGKRFGKDYSYLVDSVKAAAPDYIFFGGDLYTRGDKKRSEKIKLLKALTDVAPVYYIFGNHELDDPDYCLVLSSRLSSAGINVLDNEKCRLWAGGRSVNLYGLDLPLKYYVNKNNTYTDLPVPDVRTLEKYIGKAEEGECNLLLAHNPLFFQAYADWGADMVFAGHMHGGIVRLPFIGGLLSPERKLLPKYTKGIYKIGSSVMALTSGLGKFRFNNPSQVMVLTLSRRAGPTSYPKGKPWILR